MKTIQEKREYHKQWKINARKDPLFRQKERDNSRKWLEKNPDYGKETWLKRKNNPVHKEKQKAYYKKWYRKNGRNRSEHDNNLIKEWQIHHPNEVKAARKLRSAVKRGEVIRPKCCDCCGSIGKVSGHHKDYNKVLDVMWLCHSCHKIVHAK